MSYVIKSKPKVETSKIYGSSIKALAWFVVNCFVYTYSV